MSKGTGGAQTEGPKNTSKTRVQSLGGLQEHDALWEQVISCSQKKKGDVKNWELSLDQC